MRVWFITGASRGFGALIAAEALAQGDAVAATARDPKAVTARLGTHERLLATRLDVTSETEAHEAAEQPHADADPAGAAGVEVLHGSPWRGDGGAPLRPRTGGPLSPAAACAGIAGIATMRSGGGGSMPSRDRATISTRSGVL